MTMPLDLVLVRHGESEGNVAFARERQGDSSHFTPEFLARHSSKWRLTERGRAQAHAAGLWLRANVTERFDRYYVAEYLRAMETAAHLAFAEARWYCEFYLRERDWGVFDVMSYQERRERYAEELRRRELDTFFWAPPGGESMASLCLRIDRVLNTLHRECAERRVILVCHGEVMWAFRVRLERMSQEHYRELDLARDPRLKLHNCQVLHYTRRDPLSGTVAPHLNWRRSVCPWDASLSENDWQPIVRPSYSNEDLLAVAERTPRLRGPLRTTTG
jgi:NAD+ kinase